MRLQKPTNRAGTQGSVFERYVREFGPVDAQLGALVRALEERGLWSRTVLIVAADHGEAFGEHGIYGHGSTLYMPMLHVPLLLAGPGGWPEGKRVEEWVSLQALAPTVMELAAPSVRHPFPGPSLTRFWRGDSIGAAPLLAGSR